MPALGEDEVVIADLHGIPGTQVRLTDRRLLTGGLHAVVVRSEWDKPPQSIPYEEIVDARYLSNLAAYDEPWGMCLVLRSGETVWLHLWKEQAERATRIIKTRRADMGCQGFGPPG
jgi:hypothetical protein